MNNKLFKSAWYHGSRTFFTESNEALVNVPTETTVFAIHNFLIPFVF
jgi:hypothetical protein